MTVKALLATSLAESSRDKMFEGIYFNITTTSGTGPSGLWQQLKIGNDRCTVRNVFQQWINHGWSHVQEVCRLLQQRYLGSAQGKATNISKCLQQTNTRSLKFSVFGISCMLCRCIQYTTDVLLMCVISMHNKYKIM